MNRRSFFSAFLGAAPAAATIPTRRNAITARGAVPDCHCGFQMCLHDAWGFEDNWDGKRGGMFSSNIAADNPTAAHRYMTCDNKRCRHHGIKFAVPLVALQLADPATVKRVEAFEREEERRRLEAKEAEAFKIHSVDWVEPNAFRHRWETATEITAGRDFNW